MYSAFLPLRRASGLLLTLLPAMALQAQTIPNPGFEADTFTAFPGYVSVNAPITGWTGNFSASHGLNPAGDSPFANNGTVPEGVNVAFIQSNSNSSNLETTISGLTAGQTYQLSFRTNARAGNTARLQLSIDGNLLINSRVTAVAAANGAAPWRYVAAYFTPTATTALLTVANTADNDNTLLVDQFEVSPSTQPWSFTAWTDDASSGIDRSYVYTHAYNLGSAASFTLNSVPFTGLPGGNPGVPGRLVTAGLGSVFNNDPNNLFDGSRPLANDFLYNGFPSTVTLSGLTPGGSYVLSLFSAGWEDPTSRWGTFRSGTEQMSIDQDAFGNDNGIRIDYRYLADANGSVTVNTHPLEGNSIHLYGIANREATLRPQPVFVSQPTNRVGLNGNLVTFTGLAAGTGPISYQWLKGTTPIPGETFADLSFVVNNAATQSGFYTLRATNGAGFTLSQPAFLEVYDPQPAVAVYNTGVDALGVTLQGGEIDPHYTLVDNPDNPSSPQAFVQTGLPGAWLPNTGFANWIGPRVDTATAAGPIPTFYRYQTSFDLTGRTPAGILTGSYASDNVGTEVRINGVAVPGVPVSTTFAALTPLLIRLENLPAGTVTAGVNTLDFVVENGGVGYTGLLVDNLGFAQVPAGIAPTFVTHPQGGTIVTGASVTLSARAYGSANLTYQWNRNAAPIAGATGSTYTIPAFSAALNGDYTVTASNGVGPAQTSNIAVLTASNVPPNITVGPQTLDAALGQSLTLSVTVEGSPPFDYQWIKDNVDIPDADEATYTINPVTRADAGRYKVRVTNAFGNPTSGEGVISVFNPVPGLFSTGVADDGTLLADGEFDLHYQLLVNPGGENEVFSVVHQSDIFPISTGTWLFNSATSKWISPMANSSSGGGLAFDGGAGPGTYIYRTTFDLTGLHPASVRINGAWTSDNGGLAVRVNGTDTGITTTGNFNALNNFTITEANADFAPGLNTLDFVVQNADANAGYTGLRVQGIRGLADPAPNLPQLSITLNGSGQPVITFTGVQGTNYPIQRSTDLAPSASWSVVGTVTGGAGGVVQFTDTSAPAGRAYYRAVIPLP